MDKDFSQLANMSVLWTEPLPAPDAMAFVDSDEDEVCLELVSAFDGVALEMTIHHLWRSINDLEVAVVDFAPECRDARDVRGCKGNGSDIVLSAIVNLPSQQCHSESL